MTRHAVQFVKCLSKIDLQMRTLPIFQENFPSLKMHSSLNKLAFQFVFRGIRHPLLKRKPYIRFLIIPKTRLISQTEEILSNLSHSLIRFRKCIGWIGCRFLLKKAVGAQKLVPTGNIRCVITRLFLPKQPRGTVVPPPSLV